MPVELPELACYLGFTTGSVPLLHLSLLSPPDGCTTVVIVGVGRLACVKGTLDHTMAAAAILAVQPSYMVVHQLDSSPVQAKGLRPLVD